MPGTTPQRGLPYPLPTEPVAEGAQRIRELAEALDPIPRCRVYHNVDQGVAQNVLALLGFNSERFDTDNMHDPAAQGKITLRTGGVYLVGLQLEWETSITGSYRDIGIRLNGSVIIAQDLQPSGAAGNARQALTTLYPFAPGDYVEAFVFHDSTAGRLIKSVASYSPEFWAIRMA